MDAVTVTVTVFSLAAALADLLGGWFTLRFALLRGGMEQLMALGAGFLLGGALLSMIPAAYGLPAGPGMVTAGFVGLLLVRGLLTRTRRSRAAIGAEGVETAGAIFAGLFVHSLVDGLALGMAVQVGGQIGWVALLAVMLHKLPEGFSLASVVLSATASARLALLAVAAIGLATVLGAWGALLGSQLAQLSRGAILGLAAGSFLYVGATEMLPHALRKGGSTWLVLGGIGMIYFLLNWTVAGHSH